MLLCYFIVLVKRYCYVSDYIIMSVSDSDERMEDDNEEGECDSDEDSDNSYVEDEDPCDPRGVFDALAAAHEASRLHASDNDIDETLRQPEDFLMTSFKAAIRCISYHLL